MNLDLLTNNVMLSLSVDDEVKLKSGYGLGWVIFARVKSVDGFRVKCQITDVRTRPISVQGRFPEEMHATLPEELKGILGTDIFVDQRLCFAVEDARF